MFTENDVLDAIIIFVFACAAYYITCTLASNMVKYIKNRLNTQDDIDKTSLYLTIFAIVIFFMIIIVGLIL